MTKFRLLDSNWAYVVGFIILVVNSPTIIVIYIYCLTDLIPEKYFIAAAGVSPFFVIASIFSLDLFFTCTVFELRRVKSVFSETLVAANPNFQVIISSRGFFANIKGRPELGDEVFCLIECPTPVLLRSED